MITFNDFTGINNVVPPQRLKPSEFSVATNVDIGLTGEVRPRLGTAQLNATATHSPFSNDTLLLAVVAGDLCKLDPETGAATVLQASVGASRMWYVPLPDGFVAFSNGTLTGMTNGTTLKGWGVPAPASIGTAASLGSGSLISGAYQWALTHVRTADKQESPPKFSDPVPVVGGISITGIPVLTGHTTNVYLSSHNDDQMFLVGSTNGSSFSFSNANNKLQLPCRTAYCAVPPAGKLMAFWRGRVYFAEGKTLWATRPISSGLVDVRSDFKQFPDNITLIQPVDDGIYVGTEKELMFLAGSEFHKLEYRRIYAEPVVLGSGVTVRGDAIRLGDGTGHGTAMVCIVGGCITAGFDSGQTLRMTEGVYTTAVTEVTAAFRTIDGIPQYVAA